MDIRRQTSADLVRRITAIAGQEFQRPRALFTLLCGAGVSLGAGMPSTALLVAAMKARKLSLGGDMQSDWTTLLASADENQQTVGVSIGAEYQSLFNDEDLFPSPIHRQRFISAAIMWASSRRPPLSVESLRLSSILTAGVRRTAERESTGAKAPALGNWLAHTIYTTNFDEVIPQTLRYCGEPVIIVDHPGAHGRLQGEPNYPRVGYLHGCHLHYALRNTPAELSQIDADRTGGVDIGGLFLRFRDALRSTGLLVLGYSGWNDGAVRAIQDALADEESLPYGVYWGARFGENSLSDTALQLLRRHSHRAFMLDDGKEASQTLASLCVGLGIPFEDDVARWRSCFSGVYSHFESLALADAPKATQRHGAEGVKNVGEDANVGAMPARGSNPLYRELELTQLIQEGQGIPAEMAPAKWLKRVSEFVQHESMNWSDLPVPLLTLSATVSRRRLDHARAITSIQIALEKLDAGGADGLAAGAQFMIDLCRFELSGDQNDADAVESSAARLRRLGGANSYVRAMAQAIAGACAYAYLRFAKRWADETRPVVVDAHPESELALHQTTAGALSRLGQSNSAKQEAAVAARLANTPLQRATSLRWQGRVAFEQGDAQRAEVFFRKALAVEGAIPKAVLQLDLGRTALRQNRADVALQAMQEAVESDPEFDLAWGMSYELRALRAEAARRVGQEGKHLTLAMEALDALEKLRAPRIRIWATKLSAANVAALDGDRELAVRLAAEVRQEAEPTGDVYAYGEAKAAVSKLQSRRR